MTGTNQPPLISKSTDLLKPKKFSPHGLMVCSWVFILVVLLTTVVTFLLPETYDAFARIKIENKNRPRVYDPFWLQTEFEIIKSNPVLIRVVQDLKLTERWSLRSGDQEQVTLDDAVGLLRHSMLLRQSRNTLLIEIHAFSENPKEAAEIANAISQSYAAYRQDDARKIEIVNRATPPSRPVRPNKLLNIAIGIFVGIALGALAGLMTTFLLRRKHSPHIAAPPASSVSDRFWKRFAIAVALVLLALILIPVFAILLAIAVPAFQRAHRNSPVASEQSRPLTIKSDYIGQTYFPHRDSIEITSVERSQNEMTVKGHYKLVSEKSADLTLNITSTNKQPDHPGSNQSMHISQGEGDFELSRSNLISGMPHVSMYAHGESFAGIYFGTKEEAEKSKKMIMSSRASAETWSPIVAPGEKPDLQKILDEAKELMGRGQYEEALQRQIWFHNHALEYDQGYTGVRLSFALSQWVELGRRYPKAKEALIEIRDRNARRLAEGNGYADLFADVQAIDNELGDDEATYTLFKTIRENDPKLAKQCYFWMESVLVSKGEYQWCYENMGDPEYRFEFVRRNYETELSRQKRIKETLQRSKRDIEEIHRKNGWTNEPIYSPPDDSARMKKFAEDRFVVQVQQLIEILVGTGHKTDAEKIRDQALAVLDDAQLKSAIGDAEQKVEKKSAAVLKTKLTTRTAEPASELQFRLVLNNGETNVSSDLVTNFLDKSRAVPLHLARNILLDGTAVKAAGWQSISNGFTNFIIEFTEDGSRQFEALTATNLNRQIAVIFQGHVLVAPVIQSRIHTSTLNFPVNWSQKDLERTMNGLNWMHHRAEDLRFGPKQENVLPPLKNKWVFLNLRKNRLATNSYPDVESRAFHDWQRENGADLAATLSEKTPFLLGYGMAVVPAPANGLDNNSPTDIWYNWDLMANEPELKSHLIKNPKTGQDTYFFRTRDDTWGVLQIVGFSENPPGVKVRYKLVQNGEKPSSKK